MGRYRALVSYWYISAVNAALVGIVVYLFYRVGRAIYRGDARREYSFVAVAGHFAALLVGSGLIMLVVALVGAALFGLVELVHELLVVGDVPQSAAAHLLRFKGGNFLLVLLIVMLVTALIHLWVRRRVTERWGFLALGEEETDIVEYFIQWMTIYLAVYQFMFEGLQQVYGMLTDAADARAFFAIVLSPRNINLVVQPLLISAWMTVAMEKLRRRHLASASQD